MPSSDFTIVGKGTSPTQTIVPKGTSPTQTIVPKGTSPTQTIVGKQYSLNLITEDYVSLTTESGVFLTMEG